MKKYGRIAIAALGVLVLVFALAFPALTGVQASQVSTDPEAPVGIKAAVSEILSIQGRLTDANGVPVNGLKTIWARIYDVSTGGVALCVDDDDIFVVNGLWTMSMDFCTPTDITGGAQLYLGIAVGADAEMTPRQAIHPVPYAYNVMTGAKLDVGTIRSSAYTYVYVSPQKWVVPGASNVTVYNISEGSIQVKGNAAGTHWIYIPVDLIGQQYGVKYTFTNLRICYKTTAATSYIDETYLRILNDDFTSQNAVADTNNRISTTYQCYIVTNATNEIIDGSAMIRLVLHFANTSDLISIGNLRIALAQP